MSNRRPMVEFFDLKTGRLMTRPAYARTSARRGLSGLGGSDDYPSGTGAPGNNVYPYDESMVWGNGGPPGIVAPASPNAPTVAPVAPAGGYQPISTPYGQSDRLWKNPTSFATVPINADTDITHPVLSLNFQRNALIIQNGSTATAPDVAPTLYVGFNAQPGVGISLGLPPGVGVAWDIITPRDSIFILFGPDINTGSTVVIAGAVIQGVYSPE